MAVAGGRCEALLITLEDRCGSGGTGSGAGSGRDDRGGGRARKERKANMSIAIEVLSPYHRRAQALHVRLLAEVPLTAALLFGGDRWGCVVYVALAARAGRDVGIATLAPTNEDGDDGPNIIGVWVEPTHRRQGIGRRLLLTLAAESCELPLLVS